MKNLFPLLLLLLLLLIHHLALAYNGHHSLLTDQQALLSFKKMITFDPNSTLSNWVLDDNHNHNHNNRSVCIFNGVVCDKRNHRVVQLNLPSKQLFGSLSSSISNLTALRVLNLFDNQFYGKIPHEFSSLRHLRHLKLDMNNLHGPIPDSFAFLTGLTLVTMMENSLNGSIPSSFFSNCTSLRNVDLSGNLLTGEIPDEIGNCNGLWNLNLYSNRFTGRIPLSLGNNTELNNLDVEDNRLSGELPGDVMKKLSSLSFLHLSYNDMVSYDGNTNLEPFFASLANCTDLEDIELAGMMLGGCLSGSIGLLNPKRLILSENDIFGSVPPEIGNLSNLIELNLTSNFLNGTISREIGKLSQLEQLFLSHNLFHNSIPDELAELSHLGLLDLSNNMFIGEIPKSLGKLVRVNSMFLNNNRLYGEIPPTLFDCTDLYRLDLSYNRLTGSIPPELTGISEIRIFLNLSHNSLNGTLPIELSKLVNVQEIDVSSNNLTGSIFTQISSCIALTVLNLSHNSLQDKLPDSLSDLKNLQSLDVSDNKLSGLIPDNLNRIHTLTFLNLSFNGFEGKVPSGGVFGSLTNMSFIGNRHLCGEVFEIPACPSIKRHWFISRSRSRTFLAISVPLIFVSGFVTTICCWYRFKFKPMKKLIRKQETTCGPDGHDIARNYPRISYRELSKATVGFDDRRVIGTGSYGRVYKGILSDGTGVAIKVLQLQTGNSTKSFIRECQVLKRIRHRNLIRIITACSLPDFKALVLPYMVNGSLDSRLYPVSDLSDTSDTSDLGLIQRVNICSDIAEGMAYLHHHSPCGVIHCDLKPSNVLLNKDMTALVSDFGISRLVMTVENGGGGVEKMGNSTANMLTGSIGYIAPEYGFGSNTSTKGDVYSFGIVLLEMVSRKRPIDDMFSGELNLNKWVKYHYHGGSVDQVIDSSLLTSLRDQSREIKKMWEVAIGELIELGYSLLSRISFYQTEHA